MSQFFQTRQPRRAPRVSLQGRVSATIRLENGRSLAAKMHQLSATGGLLELATYIEERTWVALTFQLGSRPVRSTAEMMFPMRGASGCLQPFRFVRLPFDQRLILEEEIAELLKVAGTNSRHGNGFRPPRFYLESF